MERNSPARTREEILGILQAHKAELREKYGVREIGLFGSYAREEQSPLSDVDILVQVGRPIGFRFFELWDYLEEILGLKVDLLTPEALQQKPVLWESVREDVVYV
jgi:predicted nucleotidyltransferase